ncbi:hypothetical protein CTI12_AA026660 [Artemisia annua]|uniref:Transmembrane protein n=1 Tax=Artemisia annua TaxID=35608 RepID=A0A2U1QI95_ARTAN|nr:hypothetical protein CTI12_AA026660 [Artemisia annua]
MDLNVDLRYLLLPLATLLIAFSLYAYAIFTVFLLFVSIKVPLRLHLSTRYFVHFQAIDLSVSVTVCFLCLMFLSTPHFWIVNPVLMLCVSPWEDLLFDLLKSCFWWSYRNLKAIRILEFLCIFSRHEMEEAQVNQSVEELSNEPCDEDADHVDLEAGVE